jgi:hypothetical protein
MVTILGGLAEFERSSLRLAPKVLGAAKQPAEREADPRATRVVPGRPVAETINTAPACQIIQKIRLTGWPLRWTDLTNRS